MLYKHKELHCQKVYTSHFSKPIVFILARAEECAGTM